MRFFICQTCGNIIGLINDAGVPMVCCGKKMTELVPNTVEASQEKHLPVYSVKGNEVNVAIGSVAHPMLPEHHIAWVYLETEKGGQRKALAVGSAPSTTFLLDNDKAKAAYAYCNLHGLWKTEIK